MARRGGQERNGIRRYGTEKYDPTSRLVLADLLSDWDKLLPYLLFAYREVPQASTGFSQCDSVMSYLLGETTGHETIYLLSD